MDIFDRLSAIFDKGDNFSMNQVPSEKVSALKEKHLSFKNRPLFRSKQTHSSRKHAYIVLTGFTGAYIIFLISAQKHRLWVLVRTASPRRF